MPASYPPPDAPEAGRPDRVAVQLLLGLAVSSLGVAVLLEIWPEGLGAGAFWTWPLFGAAWVVALAIARVKVADRRGRCCLAAAAALRLAALASLLSALAEFLDLDVGHVGGQARLLAAGFEGMSYAMIAAAFRKHTGAGSPFSWAVPSAMAIGGVVAIAAAVAGERLSAVEIANSEDFVPMVELFQFLAVVALCLYLSEGWVRRAAEVAAGRQAVAGALWILGALLVSALSYGLALAHGGGLYVVAIGACLRGLRLVLRSLEQSRGAAVS